MQEIMEALRNAKDKDAMRRLLHRCSYHGMDSNREYHMVRVCVCACVRVCVCACVRVCVSRAF
jgi:hypothetical protein